MFKKRYIALIICMIFLTSCSGEKQIYSPDKSMKLVTRVEDNSIILSVYSKDGTLLYSENTEISDRHKQRY